MAFATEGSFGMGSMSELEKKISQQITSLWHEVANTSFTYSDKELSETQAKLDVLMKFAPERELWHLHFIQALIHFHRERYRASFNSLRQSFRAKRGEFVEGRNLELLIKSQAVRRRKLKEKIDERPILASSIAYVICLVGALLFSIIGGGKPLGQVGLAAMVTTFIGTVVILGRWVTAEKWGLGIREAISKVSIIITVCIILLIPVGVVLLGNHR
jgi:hypothetical protein